MQRYQALDACKYLGILGVVLIHSSALFSDAHRTAYDFLNLVARFAVPLFFMSSGFFLEQSLQKGNAPFGLWKKYMARLGLPLIAWTIFYTPLPDNLFLLFTEGHPVASLIEGFDRFFAWYADPSHLPTLLLTGGKYHLWFLNSMLIALTATLALRKIVAPKWSFVLAVIVWLIGLSFGAYKPSPFGLPVQWPSGTDQVGFIRPWPFHRLFLYAARHVSLQKPRQSPRAAPVPGFVARRFCAAKRRGFRVGKIVRRAGAGQFFLYRHGTLCFGSVPMVHQRPRPPLAVILVLLRALYVGCLCAACHRSDHHSI